MVLFVCLFVCIVVFSSFLPCGSSSLYIANHWLPGRIGALEFPQLLTFLVQKIPFTQKSNVGVSFDKGKIHSISYKANLLQIVHSATSHMSEQYLTLTLGPTATVL